MTGAEPTETETWTDGENAHTRSIFADGSRSELTSQIPRVEASDGRTGRAASVRSTPLGPYPYGWNFNGCKVRHSEPLLTFWFTMNVRTLGSAAGYPAQITSVSPVYANVVGGTSNNPSTYIGRSSGSTNSSPAYAIGALSVTYSAVASFNYAIRGNVGYTIWASY